ncbi:hypothetical protein M231_06742 [Tremella mesenterica]|uniref:GST N-terminal domain-containing protein n=1 Tax=Tremella mesenterica TaxID=5217 RepID=A0A4Q1BB53_TREME|nr:hypothetical protein M231_06742 [Tremella mesenterica]
MSTPKYTLYGLVANEGDQSQVNFGPYVMISKLALRFFDVPFTHVGYSFTEIRGKLAEISGDSKVSVPTLNTGEGWVTDSWKIADFLEEKYSTPEKSLYSHSSIGRSLSYTILGIMLAAQPLTRVFITGAQLRILDPPNREYIYQTRVGDPAKRDSILSQTDPSADISSVLSSIRSHFQAIEIALTRQTEKGWKYLSGENIGYADMVLFGYYCVHRLDGRLIKGVWEHEDLPKVGEWVKSMMGSGLVKDGDLLDL